MDCRSARTGRGEQSPQDADNVRTAREEQIVHKPGYSTSTHSTTFLDAQPGGELQACHQYVTPQLPTLGLAHTCRQQTPTHTPTNAAASQRPQGLIIPVRRAAASMVLALGPVPCPKMALSTSPAASVPSACAATPLLSSASRSRLRGQSSQVQRGTCTGVFGAAEDCMGGPSRHRPKLRPSHRKPQQPPFSQAPRRSSTPPAPLCSDKDGRPSVPSKPNTSAQVRM